MYYSNRNNPILGLLLLLAFLFIAFYFIQGLFYLLKWVTPFLLIATLIIKRQVLIDYAKWLYSSFKSNLLTGLMYLLLTVVGFPFVTVYLFLKAIGANYFNKMQRQIREEREGVLTDYEIVDTDSPDSDYLELED